MPEVIFVYVPRPTSVGLACQLQIWYYSLGRFDNCPMDQTTLRLLSLVLLQVSSVHLLSYNYTTA